MFYLPEVPEAETKDWYIKGSGSRWVAPETRLTKDPPSLTDATFFDLRQLNHYSWHTVLLAMKSTAIGDGRSSKLSKLTAGSPLVVSPVSVTSKPSPRSSKIGWRPFG